MKIFPWRFNHSIVKISSKLLLPSILVSDIRESDSEAWSPLFKSRMLPPPQKEPSWHASRINGLPNLSVSYCWRRLVCSQNKANRVVEMQFVIPSCGKFSWTFRICTPYKPI